MKEKAAEMMGLKVGYPSLHTGFSMYKHCPGFEAGHETSDMEGRVHGLKDLERVPIAEETAAESSCCGGPAIE